MAQDLLMLTIGDYVREGKPLPAPSHRRGTKYRPVPLPALQSAKLGLYTAFVNSGLKKVKLARASAYRRPTSTACSRYGTTRGSIRLKRRSSRSASASRSKFATPPEAQATRPYKSCAEERRGPRFAGITALNLWCGEGDLNPHELSPASTSRYLTRFPEVARNLILLILHGAVLPGVSWGIANTVAEPLQFHEAHLGEKGGSHPNTRLSISETPSVRIQRRAYSNARLLRGYPDCVPRSRAPVERCSRRT